MRNDLISKVCVVVRKKNVRSCLLPSDGEETASVGTSASGADVMAKVGPEET